MLFFVQPPDNFKVATPPPIPAEKNNSHLDNSNPRQFPPGQLPPTISSEDN